MLEIDGYTVGEQLAARHNSRVYAAVRTHDSAPVVLKLCANGATTEYEYDVLRRLNSPWVVRALALEHAGDRPVLVLEHLPGVTLSRHLVQSGPLEPELFLGVARSIAEAAADLHAAHLIHRDIKPSNLMFDATSGDVRILDLGIAVEIGRVQLPADQQSVEGTLIYSAPEQMGLVGHGVDCRSDLYSIGASFYELLTGRPPFHEKTDQELVTAHIAMRPRSVVERMPHVPLAISRIVDRLLQKDPALRYQTAKGLAADLAECEKQLRDRGDISDDLVLGSHDASDRLRFPERVYGRDLESALLRDTLARVRNKSIELVLLAGPAGIGKSALARTLREPVARSNGFLAEAKFDVDRRERPYSGFASVFEGIIDQLLTVSEDRLRSWACEIRGGVGSIGRVLLDLAPNLGFVVKDFPAVPPLSAREARERLALACIRFVRIVATQEHPLALILDDLHWADAGSLALLQALLLSKEPESLLVVGGYRDDELESDHPLHAVRSELERAGVSIQHLALAPLGLADTTAMLADVLGRRPEDTEWLARRVGAKSQHNPLLVQRVMLHLWDRGLIRYEHDQGWVWDPALTEADITEDAVALVAARIDGLPRAERELVEIASLIGTTFEVDLLVTLAGADRLDALERLMELASQGIITPCREGFKFVHDRLRAAAQTRIDPERRTELHTIAARLLLERTAPERLPRECFQIAEHIEGALEQLEPHERPDALKVLRMAGSTALEKGAPDTARHYLSLALDLQRASEGDSSSPLAVELRLQLGEAAYQIGDLDAVAGLVRDLSSCNMTKLQWALAIELKIRLLLADSAEAAQQEMLVALESEGLSLPRRPSMLRIWVGIYYTDMLLREPLRSGVFGRRAPSDDGWIVQSILMRSGGSALVRSGNPKPLCVLIMRALRSYRAFGAIPGISSVLAAYAGMRIHMLGRVKGSERYVRATEFFMQQRPSPMDHRARYSLLCYPRPYLEPRRDLHAALAQVATESLEHGDPEYALYAGFQLASSMGLCGSPLPEVITAFERWRDPHATSAVHRHLDAGFEAYSVLAESTSAQRDWSVDPPAIAAQFAPGTGDGSLARLHWILVLSSYGQFDRALARAREFKSLDLVSYPAAEFDWLFFYAMSLSAVYWNAPRMQRWRLARSLRTMRRRKLPGDVRSPDFSHIHVAVAGACERLEGRRSRAGALYQRAAQQASKQGYLHHAALLLECSAALLEEARRDVEARNLLRLAAELYADWGARGKVLQLESRSQRGAGLA